MTTFEYLNYQNHLISSRKVHPLALKESKNRWYLIAVDTNDNVLKSFGLDRIQYLDVSSGKYREKYKYNLKDHFRYSFGVMNSSEQTPQKIILKCSNQQAEYIKSFPLHHTQSVLKKTHEEMFFELHLHPTYDFIQEILSYGSEVTVIEPQTLISTIKNILKIAFSQYCSSEDNT